MVKFFIKGALSLFSFVIGAIFLYGLYLFYYAQNPQELAASVAQPNNQSNKELVQLLSVPEKPLQLDSRTKSSHCQAHDSLPDHDCSPGGIFVNTIKEQICVEGYTKKVRKVSTALRKKVYQEYGISYPQKYGSYEVDHLIPLALGGNNDVANLFLEAADPKPGFREKDVVEVYLQQEVCAGRVALSTAQAQIASDWLAVYNRLSVTQISQIRKKYNNWSQ